MGKNEKVDRSPSILMPPPSSFSPSSSTVMPIALDRADSCLGKNGHHLSIAAVPLEMTMMAIVIIIKVRCYFGENSAGNADNRTELREIMRLGLK